MATCLGCRGDATVALHAISNDIPSEDHPDGKFHYTELVFSCGDCITRGVLKQHLPEGYTWTIDPTQHPIILCPRCNRETVEVRRHDCPACLDDGCAACIALHPVGVCGDCVGSIEREAHAIAYDAIPHDPKARDMVRYSQMEKRREIATPIIESGLRLLASTYGRV